MSHRALADVCWCCTHVCVVESWLAKLWPLQTAQRRVESIRCSEKGVVLVVQARVIYTTGETEEISLDEIVRDKALSLITSQQNLW